MYLRHSLRYLSFVVVLGAQTGTSGSVGLSLFFQNEVMPPVTFFGNPSRYLQELDIATKTPASAIDAGIEPLKSTAEPFRSPDTVFSKRAR